MAGGRAGGRTRAQRTVLLENKRDESRRKALDQRAAPPPAPDSTADVHSKADQQTESNRRVRVLQYNNSVAAVYSIIQYYTSVSTVLYSKAL